MEFGRPLNNLQITFLGAIDGLAFGIFGVLLHHMHTAVRPEQISEGQHSESLSVLLLKQIPPNYGFTIIVCMTTFAIVSYLVHRFRASRSQSLLLRWQIIGVLAVTSIATGLYILDLLGEEVYYQFKHSTFWLVALVLAISVNFVLGIASSAYLKHRSQTMKPNKIADS